MLARMNDQESDREKKRDKPDTDTEHPIPFHPHTYPPERREMPPLVGPGLPPVGDPRRRDAGAIRFRANMRLGTAWVTTRPNGPTNHAVVSVNWDDGTLETRHVFSVSDAEHALSLAFSKVAIEIVDE
jgi:hypothetical protein